MTPRNLIKALAKGLREVLKDFKLSAEYQADRKVRIYEQIMPIAEAANDTLIPSVLIYLMQVYEDGTDSTATVNFNVAVYGGENEEGWQDLFNIAERVRQFVLTHPIIDDKFCLELPATFAPRPPSEQPEPFFYFDCIVQYRIATPRVSIPF